MKKISQLLGLLLALAILVGLTIGGYRLFLHLKELYGQLEAGSSTVALIGWMILGSVALLLVGMRWIRRQDHRQADRVHKAEVYRRFLQTWATVLKHQEGGAGSSQASLEWRASEKDLLVWGSRGVLRRYAACRKKLVDGKMDGAAVEMVLKEIRRDMGQIILGFEAGELYGLFMNGEISSTATNHVTPEVALHKG